MILVQDGKVAIDDKVGKYIEGIPLGVGGHHPTNLLTHTAGLTREGPGFDPIQDSARHRCHQNSLFSSTAFQTRRETQYSNLGYFMLGEVIHRVSGKSWGDFLSDGVRSSRNDLDPRDHCRRHRPEPCRWLRLDGKQVSERSKLARRSSERRVPFNHTRPGEMGGRPARPIEF